MNPNPTEDNGHAGYLFAGFASLLVAAFIDNARGPVLPVLCQQLQIPYETAGLFLMIGNVAAVLVTSIMGHLLPRFGDRKAAITVCWFAVLPGLLAPFVDGRGILLALGLLLGAAVSLVGSLSSILTMRGSQVRTRGRTMSIQQGMYGLGSFVAPLLFSALIQASHPWWWLFTGSSLVTLLLGFVYIYILPPESAALAIAPSTSAHQPLGGREIRLVCLFAFYVAGEVLSSMWMSSLLVGHQGLAPAQAAHYQMLFFLLMGLTRILCFLLVRPIWENRVLMGCVIGGSIFAILGQQGHSWALPLIGVLGPFFPLSIARVSVQFPDNWKQITMAIFVGMQIILALVHLCVGRIADSIGIEKAFLLAPAFLVLSLLLIPGSLHAPRPKVSI